MVKTYERKKAGSIAMVLLGLSIGASIFRDKTFIVFYDGVYLVCAILMLIIGIWGLITPLVKIDRTNVILKLSLFTTKTFDLRSIREMGYDKTKQILKFDSFEFKLNWMKRDEHKAFINEIKVLREQMNE